MRRKFGVRCVRERERFDWGVGASPLILESQMELTPQQICEALNAYDGERGWRGETDWEYLEFPYPCFWSVGMNTSTVRAGLKECPEAARAIVEGERAKAAIRKHRNQHGDDRCWLDDQELYAVLDDGDLGDNRVGDPAAMLENCKRFIAQRCIAGGPWVSYAELEGQLKARERESCE